MCVASSLTEPTATVRGPRLQAWLRLMSAQVVHSGSRPHRIVVGPRFAAWGHGSTVFVSRGVIAVL